MRPSGRTNDQMRVIALEPHANPYAEGSCLISCGATKVICTASVEERVPPFLRDTGKGWVTAEYGMLPRATHTRGDREAARGKQSGRTQEIQRQIVRSLRNMERYNEMAIVVVSGLPLAEIDAHGGLPPGVEIMGKPIDFVRINTIASELWQRQSGLRLP